LLIVSKPLVPPWSDGTKKLVRDLAASLDDYQLQVFTSKKQPFPGSQIDSIPIYSDSGKYNPAFFENLKVFRYLAGRSSHVDLIHFFFSPNPISSGAVKWILKRKRQKSIQTICSCPKSFENFRRYVVTDYLITLSDYAKDNIKKEGFQSVERIYPGIDLEAYQPNPQNAMVQKLGLKKESVVLYVGDYEFSGAHEDVLQAARKALNENSDTKFVFACRNKTARAAQLEKETKSKAQDLGIHTQIIFLNEIDSFKDLLDLASIVIFPARSLFRKMDIPLTLLEALALEKPIIISDIPPLNEIMKAEVGLLVPPGNVQRLSEAISKLLQNPSQRIAFGKRGREMVEEHFNLKTMVKQYEAFYRRVFQETN